MEVEEEDSIDVEFACGREARKGVSGHDEGVGDGELVGEAKEGEEPSAGRRGDQTLARVEMLNRVHRVVGREGSTEIARVIGREGAGVCEGETLTLGETLIRGKGPEEHEKVMRLIVGRERSGRGYPPGPEPFRVSRGPRSHLWSRLHRDPSREG